MLAALANAETLAAKKVARKNATRMLQIYRPRARSSSMRALLTDVHLGPRMDCKRATRNTT